MLRRCSALVLLVLALPALLQAQEYAPALIASSAEMDAALARAASRADADRQAVRDLLARPEVERTLAVLGTDREEALSRVELLEGERLASTAERARAAEAELAGGGIPGFAWPMIIITVAVIVWALSSADWSGDSGGTGGGTLPGNA